MILAKFGGSSLASSKQFKKVKAIINSNQERQIIVASAPGKEQVEKTKVTDLLLLLHAHIEYNINYQHLLENIYNRFKNIIDDLKIKSVFEEKFEKFSNELSSNTNKDYLVSRGEYFNAMILSEYLGFEFLDAKDIVYVNYDGTINYELSLKWLNRYLDVNKKYVIPGFYACTPDNEVRTFNRGGSDLTASIISRLLEVNLYENWTDVSGLFVADPRIIDSPLRIERITYNELRELAYRGANIIQQESIVPIEDTNIPIHIKNTNAPEDFGTLISKVVETNGNIITGMSGQSDYSSLTIIKDSTKPFALILKEVLNTFIKYKLTIEHIPTGIDTFSIISKTTQIKKVYFELINELRNIDGIIDITTEDQIALIAIVGRNMSYIPGVSGRIFSTLGKNKINIKVIAQASKEISIIIGVSNSDYQEAIRVLYKEFYS